MPTKRRKIAPQPTARLTSVAIECWRKGDYWGLHGALGLKIWSMPEWGCDPPVDPPPAWPASMAEYEHICEMQKQLIEFAGPPPRRWHYRGSRHGD
jgi:hypothetical protein